MFVTSWPFQPCGYTAVSPTKVKNRPVKDKVMYLPDTVLELIKRLSNVAGPHHCVKES